LTPSREISRTILAAPARLRRRQAAVRVADDDREAELFVIDRPLRRLPIAEDCVDGTELLDTRSAKLPHEAACPTLARRAEEFASAPSQCRRLCAPGVEEQAGVINRAPPYIQINWETPLALKAGRDTVGGAPARCRPPVTLARQS
jgi:hypothetical protein